MRNGETIYPVIFQGDKPEPHYIGTATNPRMAEDMAIKHLHRIKPGISIHIVKATVGEEGYTNFVDYKLNEDNTIERHVFDVGAAYGIPEQDSKMRPIVPVKWY